MVEKIYNKKELICSKYLYTIDADTPMPALFGFENIYETGIIWLTALVDFTIKNTDAVNPQSITIDAILHPFDILPNPLPANCPAFSVLPITAIPANTQVDLFGFGYINANSWGQICDHIIFKITTTQNGILTLKTGSIFKTLAVGGNFIKSLFI